MKLTSWTVLSLLLVSLTALGFSVLTTSASVEKFSQTSVTEIEWVKTPFGPLASPVSGDFSKGEHVTLIKFASGMKTPIHVHSSDYVGIVISGNTRHWIPGKPATKKLLQSGSHWSIPANQKHVSECLPGLECVMAIIQKQNFDFKPVIKSERRKND